MIWVCTNCNRPRQAGDAFPPLVPGLISNLATGRCAGEKGKPMRTFRRDERDLAEGERRKAEGQQRATTSWTQRDGWNTRFDSVLERMALKGVLFTSEDITAEVGLPTSGSPSAVGARMTAAAKRGLIRKTGRMLKAERPNQHAALLTEWQGT